MVLLTGTVNEAILQIIYTYNKYRRIRINVWSPLSGFTLLQAGSHSSV